MLAPLSKLAAAKGVAIIAVDHLTKAEVKAVYRVTGSIAFTALPEAVWAVTADADDPTERRRLFLPIKNNLAEKQPGLAFELSAQHGCNGTPCIVWAAEPVSISAEQAMGSRTTRPGPSPDERDEAEQFLRDALADGPRLAKEIEDEAKQARGIAKRTLDRARKVVGVDAFRDVIPGPWLLRIPTLPPTLPNPSRDKELGNLGILAQTQRESSESTGYESKDAKLSVPSGQCGGLPLGDGF